MNIYHRLFRVFAVALLAAGIPAFLHAEDIDIFATKAGPNDLPNVLITPHDSSAAAGNDERVLAIFLDNLGRWHRGEPLVNEVQKN